jgi:hypothetical protein
MCRHAMTGFAQFSIPDIRAFGTAGEVAANERSAR